MYWSGLVEGRFVRRYKRFFLDARLADGSTVVAHCPNTGSLLGCLVQGAPVLLEPNDNPARKLRYTWKAILLEGAWVGVDTGMGNALVEEAIGSGAIEGLRGYERVLREIPYGREGRSRIDLLLSRGGQVPPMLGKVGWRRVLPEGDERVYVEVKNTTLVREGVAAFPDAVTTRGQKHLEELVHVVRQGHRAAMVYCVQRSNVRCFAPADDIDPVYGGLLRQARDEGVEIYAMGARLDRNSVVLVQPLTVSLS